ncbi:serine O-acetyltransferase [Albimonas pacifica]|uniref:Serine O-acetyltransferase n=1 Tax=Albimonas pacifica TaxID=1114924 RepID=A0A1I3F9J1_9RHOB|nr:DapH/DapD/GlmU-related protein [Albimonas pacifica]SFI07866.1 serine O-acetyltransferase [Albimonas pacifica]
MSETPDAPETAGAPAPFRAPPLPLGDRNGNPPGISFWALVREDFATHDRDLGSQGFWALFWHRFGNWRMGVRPRLLRLPLSLIYRTMFKASEIFCGVKLSYNVAVGRRLRIDHFGGMILGARSIGDDVIVRQNTTMGINSPADLNAKPMIGNRVTIGAGAVIVGHVTIGDDVVIGANAVVTRDVPARHLAAGVPAQIRPRRDLPPA